MLICEYCEKTFANNGKLKRHQANIHDIGVQWARCEYCDYKCKDKYNLNKHLSQKHNIGVKWWICDIDDCELKFKGSSDLKRHQSAVHDIAVKWWCCDLCKQKFKTNPNLTRHYRTKHDIDTIWYDCPDCDYKAKAKHDLSIHQARIHENDKVWHHCDLCDYKSVAKTDVYRHKQHVHFINVKWHHCPIKECAYKAKRQYLLKEHVGYIHDIGDKTCDFCLLNRYKLTQYTEKEITSHICRKCLRKVTGKNSRSEIVMSNYLDTHFGTEFLLASDNKIYGKACQNYRPDKLYASPGIVLHIECDEQQHAHSGNNYSCDEKRISDIYDEFPGHKYIVIRWNPDKYKVPNRKERKNRGERLELLLKCMVEMLQNPPKDLITIIYMFYDKDNELISRNLPCKFVYNKNDI